jgi:hypothetical protein
MERSGIRTTNYESGSWRPKTDPVVYWKGRYIYGTKDISLFFKSVIVVKVILLAINAVRYAGNFLIFVMTFKPLFDLSISFD